MHENKKGNTTNDIETRTTTYENKRGITKNDTEIETVDDYT